VAVLAAAPGDTRGEYSGVASVYLPIALAVVAIVFGALAFAMIRYRARPGRAPRPTGEHTALELAIAAVIAVVVAVLTTTTFASESRIERTSPHPDLRVEATSFRWGWRFAYPALGGIASVSATGAPAVLRVPQGALVHFTVTSRDVIHSFWIPELRFKRDLFPDRQEVFDLRFPKAVSFLGGRCAVYCGLKHSDMTFSVSVMPRAEFDAWARKERAR
jgi:cytochrome c oxidase subunit II